MGPIDSVAWQALTVALTLTGLVASGLLWRLRGPVAGLRMLAVSLLPAAAYLTGTLRLLWEVGDAVVSWAVRFVFSPAVWLGIGLALTAALLFAVAGVLSRRGTGGGAPPAKDEQRSLPRRRSRKPARSPGTPEATPRASGGADDDGDMAEIEEILKRHGIS